MEKVELKIAFTEFSLMQLLDLAGFDNHRFVPEIIETNLKVWRPWVPLRGLNLKPRLNKLLHQIVYILRCQRPKPTKYGINLEVYSKKV